MINYAHRGASQYAPENTLAAFYLGLHMGANGIETDVRRTRDGALVLCHDATLMRTAGVDIAVSDCTLKELEAMDVSRNHETRYRGEHIVTLERFLYHFKDKPLHFAIEIKQQGVEKQTLQMLRAQLKDERFTITSFCRESLLALCDEDVVPPLGLLVREHSKALLDELKSKGVAQYCPCAAWLTGDMVDDARARGLQVRAWGVKTQALMEKMCALKIDSMTVNFPDKLAQYLKQ